MADMSAHERFMQGIPLNAELEAVRDGKDAAAQRSAQPQQPVRRAMDDPQRELTRSERLDLKEMKDMPGWEVFLRLAEKATLLHQKSAITRSQDDPLTNRDQIASEWAYVKLFQRATQELEYMVEAEVAVLENQQ